MVFVVLRQQSQTMQGLVLVEPEVVSKKMVRWVEGLHDETIVLVEAVVAKAKEPIKSCTHHDIELKIKKVRIAFFSLLRFERC
jgi:aspartyl/asparaginyl-tRNA synthetase